MQAVPSPYSQATKAAQPLTPMQSLRAGGIAGGAPAQSVPGRVPQPAIKPPTANAGMGPQPQMGMPQPPNPMQAMRSTRPAGPIPFGNDALRPLDQPRQPMPQQQQPMMQQQGTMQGGMPQQSQMQPQQGWNGRPAPNYGHQPIVQQGGPFTVRQPPGTMAPMPQPTTQGQVQPQQAQPMQQQYPGQPTIQTGPVYSQEQQDQLINQAIGQNAQQMGGANMAVIDRLTGGGFNAAGSPKAMALQNQNMAARMQADNAARTGIPLQIAQANSRHLLDSQMAAEDQYSNRQNEMLTGRGQSMGFLNNLFGSLLT